jgi:hypothetical protein
VRLLDPSPWPAGGNVFWPRGDQGVGELVGHGMGSVAAVAGHGHHDDGHSGQSGEQ